jgi:hypothetical protein
MSGPPSARWADLEERIEQFLAGAGYSCRRNAVVTGRSGAAHEIDVLAERSDAVTRVRLAVECKAWNRPVEKDVVAKLAFVAGDIGADKGILVALAGGRDGATRAAGDLGIDLWGPAELEARLGSPALSALAVPPLGPTDEGVALHCDAARAQRLVRGQARGWSGLRRERVEWVRPAWVAHHLVVVATTEPGRPFLGRRAPRSTARLNLYDGLGGAWWRTLERVPGSEGFDPACRVPAAMPSGRVTAAVRRAASRRDDAVSEAARQRWEDALEELGVPAATEAVTVERVETLYWPFWLGLLTSGSQAAVRLVAVDGASPVGEVCPAASAACTAQLGHVLRALIPGVHS